jgi:hypothetical protein
VCVCVCGRGRGRAQEGPAEHLPALAAAEAPSRFVQRRRAAAPRQQPTCDVVGHGGKLDDVGAHARTHLRGKGMGVGSMQVRLAGEQGHVVPLMTKRASFPYAHGCRPALCRCQACPSPHSFRTSTRLRSSSSLAVRS